MRLTAKSKALLPPLPVDAIRTSGEAPGQGVPHFPVRVFYDGACTLCAAEIGQYLRRDHGGRLMAVDISDPCFDPEPYRITLPAFMYELHVIDRDGTVYRGVEAFRAIWQAFPSSPLLRTMGWVIALPGLNTLARLLYRAFARLRPWLPKRHGGGIGNCRIGRPGDATRR